MQANFASFYTFLKYTVLLSTHYASIERLQPIHTALPIRHGSSLVVSFYSDLLTLQAFYLHFLLYYYNYNYTGIHLVTYTFRKVFYNSRTINSSFAI
jgi:hypothetical protein